MTSAGEWLEAVRAAERRGELLDAVDLAERGLAEHPGDLWLAHRGVLALARAGATQRAAERFAALGLPAHREEEDVAALEARIAKDLALAAAGAERRGRALEARDRYRAIHLRRPSSYPLVNAATLALVAGDAEDAIALAREVLDVLGAEPASYDAAATEAEARLLLGDPAGAGAALERAAAQHGGDHGALATTRRQLRLVCDLTGTDRTVLDPLAGPAVAHFCGHRILPGGRFPPEAEATAAARIEAAVAADPPAFAYGALAGGGDLLWAEALLRHGADLHVVLPFASEEFVTTSVAPCGPGWPERFERCLAAAADVHFATDDAFLGDDVLYRYGTELAMGMALLRARHLDADVRQLALWDGAPAAGAAGTAIDVATWHGTGHPVTVVPPGDGPAAAPPAQVEAAPEPGRGRVVRALLFADVQGFSRLTDEQLPRFAGRVLGAFADVLRSHGDAVLHRNTWGDALYVVLADPVEAATCALALQEVMGGLDLAAAGLPEHLALRLGVHLGPVFAIRDPVLEVEAFMGSHVSRTARIEPVTPPGEVYVTEPFAAALELRRGHGLACDHVGHMPAAKDYGRLRMHRLRRA